MKPATLKKIIPTTFFLLLLSTVYNLSSTISFAQSTEGFSAIPPRLEITVNPNSIKVETIKIRNESGREKNVTVSTEDFVVTDDRGTPSVVTSDKDNRWAASSWITISPSSFKLKAGETKNLTLTVVPPFNALPGGHYAMVVHTPDEVSLFNSTGASILTRVGTLVYITVPGDIKQNASITNFSTPKFSEFGPIDFKTTIENFSDIHIRPAGNITVTNMIGLKSHVQFNKDGTNIFPYKTRDFNNQLQKKFLFGRYKAEINAAYGTAGGIVTATIFFWVIPWRLIILLALIITVIVFTIKTIKRLPPTGKNNQGKVDELEKELEELKKKYRDQ